MAVPLMARLNADMLQKAHNLRVILQYGVGVEGIDIPAVSCTSVFATHLSPLARVDCVQCMLSGPCDPS